jgi:hypothetical protein
MDKTFVPRIFLNKKLSHSIKTSSQIALLTVNKNIFLHSFSYWYNKLSINYNCHKCNLKDMLDSAISVRELNNLLYS